MPTKEKKTPRGKPFTKGDQRINPGGRPKVPPEFKRRCSDFTDTHVLAAWEQEVIGRGEHWLKASELLAAYGKGRPTQAVEVKVSELSDEQLVAEARRALGVGDE